MSPSPISDFSKLSITQNMEETSRGTTPSAAAKGKGKAPLQRDDSSGSEDSSNEEEEQEDPNDSDDPDDSPEGSNDIPDNEQVFALDHCRQHTGDNGPTYAFQIAYAKVERYGIRIERGRPTRCSCEEPGCRHQQWLLQQLSRVPGGPAVGSATVDPYRRISITGLEGVCQELGWERRVDPKHSMGTNWQLRKLYSTLEPTPTQTRGAVRRRMRTVRDIMATLSTVLDYDGGMFDTVDPDSITTNNILVPHNLEGTLSRLLIFDDRTFRLFENLVPHDARAVAYFSKMKQKAHDTLIRWDDYLDNGPVNGPHAHQYNLHWCANTLVSIVESIHQNIDERRPLSSVALESAAHALVSILDLVVERNQVVNEFNRPKRHGEGLVNRNLCVRLIGDTTRASPLGDAFVLDALQSVPEARLYVEQLERILNRIEETGWAAPHAYRNKLRRLIHHLKGTAPGPTTQGPSSSSGKRSAGSGSTDRNVKRMK
ncbi:hypothetical protein LSUE1_G003216 [Lachnellula suecica]|uniref:SWIM-type domain-containing protein n=1 Tax=Lachnellula suecica TaxID=602035 RepID=A0A8T9BZM3_9HELO|nr:hypothetical protein LSUE1_G003216 [Lachnellula suecica]